MKLAYVSPSTQSLSAIIPLLSLALSWDPAPESPPSMLPKNHSALARYGIISSDPHMSIISQRIPPANTNPPLSHSILAMEASLVFCRVGLRKV